MPYYCTVPRCTSMAGKAKNVSFHQFPRDEELAKLWNKILKRGKPYTKYSKVCSLHFKPDDYTIASVGKNKGQWRSLRKDAIPSQNLPSDSPTAYTRTRNSGSWVPDNLLPTLTDPLIQQQMAQAIYVQTMLAMHAAGATDALNVNKACNESQQQNDADSPHTSEQSELEQLLRRPAPDSEPEETSSMEDASVAETETVTSFKCSECLKCFKDPDVFLLHSRMHTKDKIEDSTSGSEKENVNTNGTIQEKANPILANLLKANAQEVSHNILDANVLSIENHIMAALAANMENYLRNISTMLHPGLEQNFPDSNSSNESKDLNESTDTAESTNLVINETV